MKLGLTFSERSPVASVAAGGSSSDAEEEFDSPETIAAIAAALHSHGHTVELLGDGPRLAAKLLAGFKPELVFNLAEGRGIGRCREAWTPALLEMFRVPYTGSDPLTLAAALDKNFAKRLVRAAGVPVPAGLLVAGNIAALAKELDALSLPAIVKPAFEGSSKGILGTSLITARGELSEIVAQRLAVYNQPILVEEFIDGRELTVGVIGNESPEILAIMEVLPLRAAGPFVYGLEVKRNWREEVRYESPAKLTAAETAAVNDATLTAFHALGCRDVARIDFRLREGVPYFIEANPLPGLSPGTSDLVLLAEGVGIDYAALIGRILAAALRRLAAVERLASEPHTK